MIYDKIVNIDLYSIDKDAAAFIKALTPDIECKKHVINDNVYANVQEYNTKEIGYFEAHKNYIDIQILLKGEEIIEYTSVENLKVKDEYDPQKDIAFYFDTNNTVMPIKLEKGLFTVLYPHEAHKPQMIYNELQNVKKVVVKIKTV